MSRAAEAIGHSLFSTLAGLIIGVPFLYLFYFFIFKILTPALFIACIILFFTYAALSGKNDESPGSASSCDGDNDFYDCCDSCSY